ncbi:acyl-CoA thioesterase-2 [Raineyella antarctica]|uniref:Acyl-CoA thioesterase 2 n=1 Tax=Raineyella antarctica TaxID=1577474 RepID=A0A1G6GQJ3_9ACTN|nr:acyl-CoA thioesterase II [Raineyella antarctica]SDB84179.1 acyl-CoA thioesterase-2 [Raineyella antarctica]
MPKSIHDLVDLMQLEEVEPGLYRGANPRSGLQRVFGGQVLAQALMAAYRTVPEDRRVHSLHAYFLRPGQYDAPLVYSVTAERDGATFTTRSVVARQHGKQIFRLAASFKIPETGLEHQDSQPLGIPGPDECHKLDGGPETQRVFQRMGLPFLDVQQEWGVLDVRWVGEAAENAAHPSAQRFWYRTNGRIADVGLEPLVNQRLHDCTLAYLSDVSLLSTTLVTHGVSLGPGLMAVSLDHSMWFHRPFRVDDWMLFEQVSPSAAAAVGLALGRVFQDGELVSTQAQEGLIRRT